MRKINSAGVERACVASYNKIYSHSSYFHPVLLPFYFVFKMSLKTKLLCNSFILFTYYEISCICISHTIIAMYVYNIK